MCEVLWTQPTGSGYVWGTVNTAKWLWLCERYCENSQLALVMCEVLWARPTDPGYVWDTLNIANSFWLCLRHTENSQLFLVMSETVWTYPTDSGYVWGTVNTANSSGYTTLAICSQPLAPTILTNNYQELSPSALYYAEYLEAIPHCGQLRYNGSYKSAVLNVWVATQNVSTRSPLNPCLLNPICARGVVQSGVLCRCYVFVLLHCNCHVWFFRNILSCLLIHCVLILFSTFRYF